MNAIVDFFSLKKSSDRSKGVAYKLGRDTHSVELEPSHLEESNARSKIELLRFYQMRLKLWGDFCFLTLKFITIFEHPLSFNNILCPK